MIRIISGTHKGRRIQAPSNLPTRPTTDFAKEGLFNMLVNRVDFEELKALDLFAGTGNISYELASRGVPDITSVDSDFRCIKFISKTAQDFDMKAIRAVRSDVFSFIRNAHRQWNFIFADPPFDQQEATGELPGLIFEKDMLLPGGLLIIEHPERTHFRDTSHLVETRKYGKVNFSFFSAQPRG